MPTPKTWTDRAADILLDERSKRYLGMTDPKVSESVTTADPSGLRAALDSALPDGIQFLATDPSQSTRAGMLDSIMAALAAKDSGSSDPEPTPPPSASNELRCPSCGGTVGQMGLEHVQRNLRAEGLSPLSTRQEASDSLDDAKRLRAEYAGLSFPLGSSRETAEHERKTGLYYIDRILARLTADTSASSQEAEE